MLSLFFKNCWRTVETKIKGVTKFPIGDLKEDWDYSVYHSFVEWVPCQKLSVLVWAFANTGYKGVVLVAE